MKDEPRTNINISGVPIAVVEKLRARDRNFSRAAVEALEKGVKLLEGDCTAPKPNEKLQPSTR